MSKSKFHFFKISFALVAIFVTSFTIVEGLFDQEYESIIKLIGKALFLGIGTGLIMGLLNLLLQIDVKDIFPPNDKRK